MSKKTELAEAKEDSARYKKALETVVEELHRCAAWNERTIAAHTAAVEALVPIVRSGEVAR